MKRSGPPVRRTRLVAKTPLRSNPKPRAGGKPLRAKGIRAVSSKKRRENDVRLALVKRLAAAGVGCEVCYELAAVYGVTVPGGCSGLGGIHERRKRSGVGTVEHAPNLIPLCNHVNGWVEDSTGPESARELCGSWLIVRPRDPEWPELGRRPDIEPIPVVVQYCGCGHAYVTVPPSGRLACGHQARKDPDARPA